MKTLIYTTAFGQAHFYRLAECMLRSLRRRGHKGDAAILCDREPGFPETLGARVFVAPPDRSILYKASLSSRMDTSEYDRVLFVDSDVVFLRDPAPLFTLGGDRLLVSRDHGELRRNTFNLTFFTREERARASCDDVRAINTGVLLFPGCRFAEYAAHWLRAWSAPEVRRKIGIQPHAHAELRDQPVLQRLIARGEIDCGYLPDEMLLMPLYFKEIQTLHPDTVLLHLNGSSRAARQKESLVAVMEELNDLDGYEAFRRVCDRLQAEHRGH